MNQPTRVDEIPLGPVDVLRAGAAIDGVPLHALRVPAREWPDAIEVGLGEKIDDIIARLIAIDGAPDRAEIERRIRFNHPGIELGELRVGSILQLSEPNPRAPTQRELLSSPIVRRELEAAWADSRADDPAQRHEEGGWIHMNVKTGVVFTHRALSGANASIDLSNPILYVDAVIVGTYHTHPHPREDRFDLGPSLSDRQMDDSRGVPGIVRSRAGYHVYGAEMRASLSGRTGFFPGTDQNPLGG